MTEARENEWLLRYSAQILLPSIDYSGQLELANKTVLILGAGGLGCPLAIYLAASGIGNIILVDADYIELSNLQRQIAYTDKDIGKLKVDCLANRCRLINPNIKVKPIAKWFDDNLINNIESEIGCFDVICDATDNFETRDKINRFAVSAGVPLVSGSALGFEGEIIVLPNIKGINNKNKSTGCYHCLYPPTELNIKDKDENCLGSCSEQGVVGPIVGMIGASQAYWVISILLKMGVTQSFRHRFLGNTRGWVSSVINKDKNCKSCNSGNIGNSDSIKLANNLIEKKSRKYLTS